MKVTKTRNTVASKSDITTNKGTLTGDRYSMDCLIRFARLRAIKRQLKFYFQQGTIKHRCFQVIVNIVKQQQSKSSKVLLFYITLAGTSVLKLNIDSR